YLTGKNDEAKKMKILWPFFFLPYLDSQHTISDCHATSTRHMTGSAGTVVQGRSSPSRQGDDTATAGINQVRRCLPPPGPGFPPSAIPSWPIPKFIHACVQAHISIAPEPYC